MTTDTSATAGVTRTADTYIDAWNELDGGRRARLVESAWAADGQYLDPMLEAAGHAAISDMAAAVHARYPGHRFRRVSGVDVHHDRVRFAWELVGPDGAPVVGGIDIGELAPDGRLQRITGFFGDLPAA
jgi:hypothetical protein